MQPYHTENLSGKCVECEKFIFLCVVMALCFFFYLSAFHTVRCIPMNHYLRLIPTLLSMWYDCCVYVCVCGGGGGGRKERRGRDRERCLKDDCMFDERASMRDS